MKEPAAHHPFYRPLWRRIAIVATTVVWTGFELIYSRDGFWGIIALAFLAYSVWTFFITYKPPPEA